MLDMEDFGPNPHAPEFGGRGLVYVRWGKAAKGGPPKRRSVLTVFPWSVEVMDEWVNSYRTLFDTAARGSALWPSERGAWVITESLGRRFIRYRDAVGLPRRNWRALLAPFLRYPPDRGWIRPTVCPAISRSLPRFNDRYLHVRIFRLQNTHLTQGARYCNC